MQRLRFDPAAVFGVNLQAAEVKLQATLKQVDFLQ